MRLLHTSDWHVGRTFHGADLLAEQESVLGGLADLVAAERVDVVVISGDVYDRAVPSADAVQVCARVLAAIRAAGAELVIISGNHDSAARLGAFGEFASAGGLHLRTRLADIDRPARFADQHGPIAVYGIPYLEPETARHALGVEGTGHHAVLGEAMRRVRADLAPNPARSVVLAHAFVTGGAPSESERPIALGGVEQVPASVFEGVDYVALGHLHGPQRIDEHIRYSGSPLAYSFSEASHRKSVFLVEFDASGLSEVERRELPVPRRLVTLTGRIDELLADPAHESHVDSYVSSALTDRVRPVDALRRLRTRFPHAVHVEWRPDGGRADSAPRYASVVRGRDDHEIACGFVDDCRGTPPGDRERALLGAALTEVGAGDAAREAT